LRTRYEHKTKTKLNMKKNTSTPSERLVLLRQKLELDQTKFSTECDISYSLLTKLESKKLLPSEKVIKKISDRYGNEAAKWILTGDGELKIEPEAKPIQNVEVLLQTNYFLQQQLNIALSVVAKLTGSNVKSGKGNALDFAGLFNNSSLRAAGQ